MRWVAARVDDRLPSLRERLDRGADAVNPAASPSPMPLAPSGATEEGDSGTGLERWHVERAARGSRKFAVSRVPSSS